MRYSCTECGSTYHTEKAGFCPDCGASPLAQLCIEDTNPFDRFSKLPKGDYVHRPRKSEMPKDFTIHSPEEYTFIEDYEQSPVIIDYLCFTVKLADFRHCRKESPYSGIHFPTEPVFNAGHAKSVEDLESYNNYFREVYLDYLQETVRRFITHVLGFNYGAPRGFGFNYYRDSFVLTDANGTDFCGQVGFGGNLDTIHFQINGHGCKHLFAQRSCNHVHHWLSHILGVKHLARLDLAFDDYDGVHTCEAAEKAAMAGLFKRARGFSPRIKNGDEYQYSDTGKVFFREERDIGSRQSNVYWRIYNKKLERNIEKPDFSWYRSEVELKKWDTDILLNPLGGFAALCPYAASLLPEDVKPVRTTVKAKKRVACDVLSASFWAKRQYGRLVNSLMDLYQGDSEKVVSMLLRDDGSVSFSSMHRKLIQALE
ncbi:replication initiation factor domain-containing protein [Vibrio porteresiae]|uniref:Replication initiation factor domain-containing protein n=1 Tax=Vibrio porteresiae DSM 19223 TaxID=1123496 RepID=A0ABZ0Q817_9VIBR|nr:replication initiation factor domain-containing protein [Vibrio porteresiae]WPC72550.1 replication initiation factor domain-containing protein [Vibrio porteresiae DSM 19223]